MTRARGWAITLGTSVAFWLIMLGAWWLSQNGPGWAVRALAYSIGGAGLGVIIFGAGYLRGVRDSDAEVMVLRLRLVVEQDTLNRVAAALDRVRALCDRAGSEQHIGIEPRGAHLLAAIRAALDGDRS